MSLRALCKAGLALVGCHSSEAAAARKMDSALPPGWRSHGIAPVEHLF